MCDSGGGGGGGSQSAAAERLYAQTADIAGEQNDFYKENYRPLEQELIRDARVSGGLNEQEDAAGRVAAEVEAEGAAQQDSAERRMASMGINPASTAWKDTSVNNRLGLALAKVGGKNAAREAVKQQGMQKRLALVGVGKGAAGQAIAGLSNAAGGYAGMANAQRQADAQESAGTMGAFGSIVGAGLKYGPAILAASSKKLKTDMQNVSDAEILDEVKSLPVEKWAYKYGAGDGGSHVGPYAEDVQSKFGDRAAPGGKMIDLVSMNGINLAATKALSKKVDNIERAIGLGSVNRGAK